MKEKLLKLNLHLVERISRDVWLIDAKTERSEPIFKKEIQKIKSGDKKIIIKKEVISGYIDTTTFQPE